MYKKFQVCFLGSSKCGKSAIISRYLWDHWIDEYNPTIEEHWSRNENIDGEDCTVLLHHDINLIDDYQSLIVPLMEDTIKRTDGVVIAYKISRRSSFDEIEQMRASVLRLVEKEQWPMILIETHCDQEDQRVVSREEGEAVARRWGVPFISTSARTNINVREAIIAIMREIKTYKHIKWMKQQGIYKKPIPKLEIPPLKPSTMINDIMTYLFDNKVYSDLTLVADNKPIYVHKSILFSRFPSFMERIKLEDKDIALEPSIKYSAMLSVLKYVYSGKFERDPNITNEEYLAVIKRWEVFTLLPMMKNEPVEEFETKFDRLFNLNFTSDLIVVVVSKKKHDEIYCHKMILCARSEYFRAMYQRGFKETDNATLIIDDCSYEAVMWLVKYLYLDQFEVNNFDILPEILMLSHRYYIEPCLRFIEHYLASHLTIENVCSALMLSKQYALRDLKRVCKEYVSYRYKPVSKTSAFKKLDKAVQNRLKSAQKEGPWDIEGGK